MVDLSKLLPVRSGFLSDPERMLFCGVIVAAVVQWFKMWLPLLNGWGAALFNLAIAAVLLTVTYPWQLSWNTLAVYLCISLVAAGIHGTMTKVGDYPSPHDNPTPSGTPAQNFDKIM